MIKQPLNEAQIELLNTVAHLESEEDLRELKHTLALFFAKLADKEMDRLWDEGVINDVMKNVKIALKDPTNYTARANICRCSYVPLEDIIISGSTHGYCVHNLEKPMTATYHRTHGEMLAIMFPAWFKVMYEKNIPEPLISLRDPRPERRFPVCPGKYAGKGCRVYRSEGGDLVRRYNKVLREKRISRLTEQGGDHCSPEALSEELGDHETHQCGRGQSLSAAPG